MRVSCWPSSEVLVSWYPHHCFSWLLPYVQAPAQTFPLRMGVMADPGMTYNTSVMLDKLTRDAPDLVALIGDFVYAGERRLRALQILACWIQL